MANYRKSFNFRSGVQVDTSNFIVNTNGLVGLGTTVPTQLLDVYGNIRSTGIVTSSEFYSGIGTITSSLTVGSAVTITSSGILVSSGVITATSFVGNITGTASTAQGLTGTPNITVGIVTATSAIIGSGVTINSSGILASAGVITATSFVGNVTGNLTGNVTGNINSSGVSTFTAGIIGNVTGTLTGTASTAQGLTGTPNIVVGLTTATSVTVGSAVTINSSGITATGIVTATQFKGDGSGLTNLAAIGSGLVIKDNNSNIGTAGTINFGTGLSVTPIVAGIVTVNSTGIGSIFEDLTPQLGNDLNLGGFNITGNGSVNATNLTASIEISAASAVVGSAVTITSSGVNVTGIVTATGGFISVANTSPIKISLVGNQLTFTAVGIGSTTLTLA